MSLDEERSDVMSRCGKCIHLACAARFCGKECKCSFCSRPKEGIMVLKNFTEWYEVKCWTGGFQSRVRCTIPIIDNDDGFYYKFHIAVGEGGRKTYLHNCEDLWMHFRGGEKSLNI